MDNTIYELVSGRNKSGRSLIRSVLFYFLKNEQMHKFP